MGTTDAPKIVKVPEHIFREYDIRGIAAAELTSDTVRAIAQAYGTYLSDLGIYTVTVGGDARLSTPRIKKEVIDGLLKAGTSVIDIGLVSTPTFYWSLYHFGVDGGVMITGSHNPSEFNGLKLAQGKATIWGDDIKEIYRIITEGRTETSAMPGRARVEDISGPYLDMLISKITLGPRKLKVVLDSGNGTGGLFAPDFARAIGCDVVELFSEPDGHFPNHHPDPTKREYLPSLINAVLENGADAGIGFDGDSDRIGVVDDKGSMIFGDQLMLLFWKEILPKHDGATVIVEIKSSMMLPEEAVKLGGRPIWWKSGHSLVKAKMREENAIFSGEVSGHMFFADEYYGFDDAFYAAGRLLRILSNTDKKLSELTAEMPSYPSTAETRFACPDEKKLEIVERVRDGAKGLETIDVDGVRIIHENGWSLLRSSNTQPILVARCEGRTTDDLRSICDDMRHRIKDAGGPDFEWEY
ncbi:MAG: phosphomannomutase/phosphoglucomutase [Synergistaceae bacterium]|jgi:phosphomannomutase/phosphoglucomutase|nr:phosphomannomutase/phosphoglucomutase [Synergistaceae bacterium]